MNKNPPIRYATFELIRKTVLLILGLLCAGLGVGRAFGASAIDLEVLLFLLAAGLILMLDKMKEFAVGKDGVSAKLQDLEVKVNEVEQLALQTAQPAVPLAKDASVKTARAEALPDKTKPSLVLPPITDPEDPQYGRFGKRSEAGGRRLSSRVEPMKNSNRYFHVYLEVSSTDPKNPLVGSVVFFLHHTFDPAERIVAVTDGKAVLELISYGAFTVGAVADEGQTLLELNLADNPFFPKRFRDS